MTGTMNRRVRSVRQQAGIADAHRLESALEPGIEPAKPASRSAVALALEQQSDGDRRQRPRKAVGRQHGEHDGEAERREQIFGGSLQGRPPT